MGHCSCNGLCTTEYDFTPKRRLKTAEEKRKWHNLRVYASRNGLKLPDQPSYKTHLFCSVCEVWIPRGAGYTQCPCCNVKLRGLKPKTIEERVVRSLWFTTRFLLFYLVLCYVAIFGVWIGVVLF